MLTFNLTVPLSVDFTRPEDYLIFLFHILFATGSALLAGSVVIGIMSTRALHSQNRFIFMLNTSISDTLTGVPTLCATSQNELPMHNAHAQFPTTLGNPLSEDPPINLSYPV